MVAESITPGVIFSEQPPTVDSFKKRKSTSHPTNELTSVLCAETLESDVLGYFLCKPGRGFEYTKEQFRRWPPYTDMKAVYAWGVPPDGPC